MVDVELNEISKQFETPSGTETAVDNVNIRVDSGQFFSLVGPSGCGKTTTLRMIAGLETPTSGNIYFDNTEVTNLSPQERDIAMVFQNVTLFPHMTNYENIEYGLKIRGRKSSEYIENIDEVTQMLGITDIIDKKPGAISGGQQQRVSLARALVRNPNLILFDEPLSDLDAKLKSDLRVRIQRIHEEFNTTMIYVTHSQQEAMTLSDQISVMNNGEIAQQSPPTQLFDSPDSQFIAEFIGQPTINILDAHLDNGKLSIEEEPGGFDVKQFVNDKSEFLSYVGKVKVGFRPKHTNISDENNLFHKGKVDVIESLGVDSIMYLIDDFGNEIRIVVADPSHDLKNEVVGIDFPKVLYFFSPETGEKLFEMKKRHSVEPVQETSTEK